MLRRSCRRSPLLVSMCVAACCYSLDVDASEQSAGTSLPPAPERAAADLEELAAALLTWSDGGDASVAAGAPAIAGPGAAGSHAPRAKETRCNFGAGLPTATTDPAALAGLCSQPTELARLEERAQPATTRNSWGQWPAFWTKPMEELLFFGALAGMRPTSSGGPTLRWEIVQAALPQEVPLRQCRRQLRAICDRLRPADFTRADLQRLRRILRAVPEMSWDHLQSKYFPDHSVGALQAVHLRFRQGHRGIDALATPARD